MRKSSTLKRVAGLHQAIRAFKAASRRLRRRPVPTFTTVLQRRFVAGFMPVLDAMEQVVVRLMATQQIRQSAIRRYLRLIEREARG